MLMTNFIETRTKTRAEEDMQHAIKRFYFEIDASYEAAAKTAHSAEKLLGRLGEFERDETFARMLGYAHAEEYKSMRIEISALSGMSKYLGFTRLADCCDQITDRYYHMPGYLGSAAMIESLEELKEYYEKTIEGIRVLYFGGYHA